MYQQYLLSGQDFVAKRWLLCMLCIYTMMFVTCQSVLALVLNLGLCTADSNYMLLVETCAMGMRHIVLSSELLRCCLHAPLQHTEDALVAMLRCCWQLWCSVCGCKGVARSAYNIAKEGFRPNPKP